MCGAGAPTGHAMQICVKSPQLFAGNSCKHIEDFEHAGHATIESLRCTSYK